MDRYSPEALQIRAELVDLVQDYWLDVDCNTGAGAHLTYTQDGMFQSENTTLTGPDQIRAFYDWRRARGARLARHLVSNPRVEIGAPDRATVRYVMSIYAGDGVPVLPVTGPALISDMTDHYRREADGRWLCAHRGFVHLFRGSVPVTTIPAELVEKLRREGGTHDEADRT